MISTWKVKFFLPINWKFLLFSPRDTKKTLLFFCEADIEMITISYFKKELHTTWLKYMHTPIHIFQRYEVIFSMSVFPFRFGFYLWCWLLHPKRSMNAVPVFHRYTQCYTTSFIFLCYEYINFFFPSFNLKSGFFR